MPERTKYREVRMPSNGRDWIIFEGYPTSGGYPFTTFKDNGTVYNRLARNMFAPTDATHEELTAVYKHWAPQYDGQHPWVHEYGRNAVQLVGKPKNGVVDLGTGTGLVIEGLIDSGVEPNQISGLDVSSAMLNIARQKTENGPLKGVKLVEFNLDTDSLLDKFERGSLDLITASYSLHHAPRVRWGRVLTDISEVLSDNGNLVVVDSVSVGAPDSLAFRKFTHEFFGGVDWNVQLPHIRPSDQFRFPVGYQIINKKKLR